MSDANIASLLKDHRGQRGHLNHVHRDHTKLNIIEVCIYIVKKSYIVIEG